MKDKWIPLYDRYPPYDKSVLVTDGDHCQIRILRLDHGIKYWESLSKCNMTYAASHWMNLPEPPK